MQCTASKPLWCGADSGNIRNHCSQGRHPCAALAERSPDFTGAGNSAALIVDPLTPPEAEAQQRDPLAQGACFLRRCIHAHWGRHHVGGALAAGQKPFGLMARLHRWSSPPVGCCTDARGHLTSATTLWGVLWYYAQNASVCYAAHSLSGYIFLLLVTTDLTLGLWETRWARNTVPTSVVALLTGLLAAHVGPLYQNL